MGARPLMGAPTREFCKRQLGRLTCLVGFPADERGIQELLDTLCSLAYDDKHARRVVDIWLANARFAPTPADLRALARATRPAEAKPSFGCEACGGTGWQHLSEANAVTRCACLKAAIQKQEATEVARG